MLRYFCDNPNCLRTFLSPYLDIFRKCESCGNLLKHVGKPERAGEDKSSPYPKDERKDDLKIKYVELRRLALKFGLTDDQCQMMGRAIRKLPFKERKRALEENGLWEEGVIYKHVQTKEGLMKMVIDQKAMREKGNKDCRNGN